MSNYITARRVVKGLHRMDFIVVPFSFISVFNMTKKLEQNYMVESGLVKRSNAGQRCGKVLSTLKSLFISYPSALRPRLVQSLLTQHVGHVPLKPHLFQFCAILQSSLYERENEMLFLLICLTIPWILELRFKSSNKSKENYFGAKGGRRIVTIRVCCDSHKGNGSDFFPVQQGSRPGPAWQLPCPSVLTLLVCPCCHGLCEALDCGLTTLPLPEGPPARLQDQALSLEPSSKNAVAAALLGQDGWNDIPLQVLVWVWMSRDRAKTLSPFVPCK